MSKQKEPYLAKKWTDDTGTYRLVVLNLKAGSYQVEKFSADSLGEMSWIKVGLGNSVIVDALLGRFDD